MKNKFFNQILPYFGSFIIFLGVTRLILFYGEFGIRIIDFIDFTEILTSFLDIIMIVVVMSIFSIVQRFLLTNKSESEENKEKRKKLLNEKSFLKRLPKYFSYYQLLFFTSIGQIIVFYIYSLFKNVWHENTILYVTIATIGAFIFLVISFEIDIKHKQLESNKSQRQFTSILLNSLLSILLVMFFTYRQIEEIRNQEVYLGVEVITTDNVKIKSTPDYFYIGKTKEFIFFFDSKLNKADAIPMTRINSISFLKRNK